MNPNLNKNIQIIKLKVNNNLLAQRMLHKIISYLVIKKIKIIIKRIIMINMIRNSNNKLGLNPLIIAKEILILVILSLILPPLIIKSMIRKLLLSMHQWIRLKLESQVSCLVMTKDTFKHKVLELTKILRRNLTRLISQLTQLIFL